MYISHVLGKMFVARQGCDDLGNETSAATSSGTNDAQWSAD